MSELDAKSLLLVPLVAGWVCACSAGPGTSPPEAVPPPVPGVVVDHAPVSTERYMPSPSIVALPNGTYVLSHDYGSFDHNQSPDVVRVFASKDRGRSWTLLSEVAGRWDTLFHHRGALYLMGPDGMYGNAVVRRSTDGGRTWSEPRDGRSGLIRDDVPYHSAAVPVVVHDGRIWRAFEIAEGDRPQWTAVVFSAPEDADLLDADSWRVSEPIHHGGRFRQWIEGNVVVAPGGGLVDILRANGMKGVEEGRDKAVIVHVSEDGRTLSHDPETDVIDFPGGGSKFTIRFDEESGRHWALVNKQTKPPAKRNVLVLTSSRDLRTWRVEREVLSHPDEERVGFHYADWVVDGDDIIVGLRTAYFDGAEGPRNYHDNNFITFHRVEGFRKPAGNPGGDR